MLAAAVLASLFGDARLGEARVPVESPQTSEATPAVRYAALDASSCTASLIERGIAFAPVDSARGVLAPIRLTGPVHGVSFHISGGHPPNPQAGLAAPRRAASPYEILDCRLALALDDFAKVLERHGVREVVHLSMYRPPPKGWASGRIGGQHGGGLAIDAAEFIKEDGSRLVVDRDFDGKIGDVTCGPRAVEPRTVPSAELRSIACEAAEEHLFHVELTPDYNQKHKNHFHLEVTANVRWFLVR
jgi:hypothetical protein